MASFNVRAAVAHRLHLRAQQAHAEYVEPLPAHILFAHVHHALQAEERAYRGRGHTVLPRAGLGDDAFFAHAPRQQRLTQAVVDFVRAGVQQIFALQPDARAAQSFGEPFGEIQRRGAARVGVQQSGQFGLKSGILARFQIGRLQFFDRRHQHFGHVPSAVRSEVPALVRLRCHRCRASRAACRNSLIFLWSFFPGALSMREQASTPHGRANATAAATFDASSPPATMMRQDARAARYQSKALPAPP